MNINEFLQPYIESGVIKEVSDSEIKGVIKTYEQAIANQEIELYKITDDQTIVQTFTTANWSHTYWMVFGINHKLKVYVVIY